MNITPATLLADGFTANAHADAYNRGDYCAIIDDTDLVLIKFNNPLNRVTEWTVRLSMNMPADKLLRTIDVLTDMLTDA
jgi:hypothetical protein